MLFRDGIFTADFKYGFIKPVKDACASIITTICISTFTNFLSQYNYPVFGLSFNTYIFIGSFIFIAFGEDWISSFIYDIKSSYYEPFNTFSRILGIIVGTTVFGGVLTALYEYGGGSPEGAFIAICSSLIILIVSTFFRLGIWMLSYKTA